MFKLKKGQESFTMVDGPDEGKTFEKDVEYERVPLGYESRFEKVKFTKLAAPKINGKKGGSK